MTYRVYLCGGDERLVRQGDCPNVADHTPEPLGYGDWFEWAERMGRTHKQRLCAGCNRLAIWGPKGGAA